MLAKIYALDNDTGASLRSLEKAIKSGYDNRQSIEMDPAFISLKKEKKFNDIIEKIK